MQEVRCRTTLPLYESAKFASTFLSTKQENTFNLKNLKKKQQLKNTEASSAGR